MFNHCEKHEISFIGGECEECRIDKLEKELKQERERREEAERILALIVSCDDYSDFMDCVIVAEEYFKKSEVDCE